MRCCCACCSQAPSGPLAATCLLAGSRCAGRAGGAGGPASRRMEPQVGSGAAGSPGAGGRVTPSPHGWNETRATGRCTRALGQAPTRPRGRCARGGRPPGEPPAPGVPACQALGCTESGGAAAGSCGALAAAATANPRTAGDKAAPCRQAHLVLRRSNQTMSTREMPDKYLRGLGRAPAPFTV